MTSSRNRPRTTARSFKVPKEPHLLASTILRMPLISIFVCVGRASGSPVGITTARPQKGSGFLVRNHVCFGDICGNKRQEGQSLGYDSADSLIVGEAIANLTE